MFDLISLILLPSILIAMWYFLTKKNKRTKIMISIEGNIGVGKTSMMKLLENKIKDADFIYEPVDEWHTIQDDNGKDILQTFYEDNKRWSYTFQNIAYITRMNHIIDRILNSSKKYIIIDRSLQADLNTFAKMLYESNCLTKLEWNAYNRWNGFFEKFYGTEINHLIIYLECEPDIAYQRMQIRGREAEKNIPFEYLKRLQQYHDKWLTNKQNVLTLNVNRDFLKNKEKFNEMYKKILNFI